MARIRESSLESGIPLQANYPYAHANDVQTLKALGTDDGIVAGESIRRVATGNAWRCLTAAASTSTWEPCNGEWNIEDFGASPSETAANNTTYINDALTSAPAGARVVIPDGTFEFNDALVVAATKSGMVITGVGPGSELKSTLSTQKYGIAVVVGALNVVVENLTLIGAATAEHAEVLGGAAIAVNTNATPDDWSNTPQVGHCTVRYVHFTGPNDTTGWTACIANNRSEGLHVYGCRFDRIIGKSATGYGYGITASGSDIKVHDNHFFALASTDHGRHAVYLNRDCDNGLIAHNHCENFEWAPIAVATNNTGTARGVRIIGNTLKNCHHGDAADTATIGVVSVGTGVDPEGTIIVGNVADDCQDCMVRLEGPRGVIADNAFYNIDNLNGAAAPHAIHLVGSHGTRVTGNVIHGIDNADVVAIEIQQSNRVNVSDNEIDAAAIRAGIRLNSSATAPSDCVIVANSINASSYATSRIEDATSDNPNRIDDPRTTLVVAGDFALSAGWGDAATVSAVSTGSTDRRGGITVTSSGTGQGANPTVVMTFTDGAFSRLPRVRIIRNGGSQLSVTHDWNRNTTTWTMTWRGTPVAAETFSFEYEVEE